MSQALQAAGGTVVGTRGVIVSQKKPAEQVKFRWDPDLIEEVRQIAEKTDRTINQAGELLMRWAVERAKAELELSGVVSSKGSRKK